MSIIIKRPLKVYISGPISGLERDEYLYRFAIAEQELNERGYRVVNPTKFLPCRWLWLYRILGYKLTLCYDIYRLMCCDAILILPDSGVSKGSNIERQVGYYMGLKYISEDIRKLIADRINARKDRTI